jgi:hypothetical protein
VTFVSFLAYASEGSTIDLGGAKLTITGSTKSGYVKLMVGVAPDAKSAPRELTDLFKLEAHDKALVAALPVLTIRLDPVAGVWDLYMFNRLIAEDIPLVNPKGSDKKFTVHAGAQGALLFSVVDSDENPSTSTTTGMASTMHSKRPSPVAICCLHPRRQATARSSHSFGRRIRRQTRLSLGRCVVLCLMP